MTSRNGYAKTPDYDGPVGPMNRVSPQLGSGSVAEQLAIKKGFTMFVRSLAFLFMLLSAASVACGQMYPGASYDTGYGGGYQGAPSYGMGAGGYDAGYGSHGGSACGCAGCGGGGESYPTPGYGVRAHSLGGLVQGGITGLHGLAQRPAQNFMSSPAGPAQANALFGWMRPRDAGNGYHPGAAAHPPMFGPSQMAQQPGGFPGMEGGYQDMGGTCCGPHWFDFAIEAVFLARTGDDGIGLMSQGIRGLAPPNIVLGSGNIDFDLNVAFRATAHWQLNAVNFVEGIYLGGLDWDDDATVTAANNSLYSIFSDFGVSPFGGFEDSDQASSSTLAYDSELDSVEVNWRRGWISPDNKFSGTWLIGGRYIRLQDTLLHEIRVTEHFDDINMVQRGDEFTRYDIDVENDMAGAQVGTELVRCLSPGMLLGVEGKLMGFANRVSQTASLQSTTLQPGLQENDKDTDFSWGTEGRVFAIWQFHPWMKLRVGYEALFLNDVATAFGNYNGTPPFLNPFVTDVRTPNVGSDESLFFHGLTAGFELGW